MKEKWTLKEVVKIIGRGLEMWIEYHETKQPAWDPSRTPGTLIFNVGEQTFEINVRETTKEGLGT